MSRRNSHYSRGSHGSRLTATDFVFGSNNAISKSNLYCESLYSEEQRSTRGGYIDPLKKIYYHQDELSQSTPKLINETDGNHADVIRRKILLNPRHKKHKLDYVSVWAREGAGFIRFLLELLRIQIREPLQIVLIVLTCLQVISQRIIHEEWT